MSLDRLIPLIAQDRSRQRMVEEFGIDLSRPLADLPGGDVATVMTGTFEGPGGEWLNVPTIDPRARMTLADPVGEGLRRGEAEAFPSLQEAVFAAILKSLATGVVRRDEIQARRKKK